MKKLAAILVLCLTCVFCAIGFMACSESVNENLTDKNDVKQEQTVNEKNTDTPVTPAIVNARGIALNKTSVSMCVGDTVVLVATFTPANTTDKTVTWKSSNTSVATVLNGTITAVKTGTATITATTANGKTATCSVMVTQPTVQPVYYTVTFNSNGGSNVSSQSVEKNGTILKPTNPTKSGYAFVGWYKNSSLTTEWNFNSNTVTNNIVLYAKWQEDKFWNFDYTSNSSLCVINNVKDKTVTEITIPNGVTHIASSAFKDCVNLKKIVVPDSVVSIENGAFRGCYSLEEITIPFIGNRADVTVTDTMQYPFGYIFGEYNYTGANEITQSYHKESTYYSTQNIYYIPSSLKAVTVTGGDVLYGAFYGCYSLTSIKLPESATIIDAYAFYNCRNLTSITLPNNIKKIDVFAFSNCSKLNSITVPDKVAKIDNYAFSSCSALKDVFIPNSVTEMGYSVFTECSALENITLPFAGENSGLKSEDNYTQYPFGYIFGESNYTGTTATMQPYITNKGNTNYQKTYYIPDSLKTVTIIGESIEYCAFWNCKNFTIIIGDSVTDINTSPFGDCECEIQWGENPTISWIGYYAFNRYHGKLDEFIIPDSVTNISPYAFYGCYGIKKIIMSNNVTSIGDYAFYGCYGIKKIVMSDNVTSIGEYTFYNCGFVNFEMPNSLTKIGAHAFDNCLYLTDIVIPDNVKTIGEYAFTGCTELKNVVIGSGVQLIREQAFYFCQKLMNVVFKNPISWRLTITANVNNKPKNVYLSSDKFDNESTNAEYLKQTYNYYKWEVTN